MAENRHVENRHIASLDGLRGFAAATVVVSHLDPLIPALGHVPWLKMGSPGVAIFFALSGFLMAYLYGGRPLTRAAGAGYLLNRFARIYPVYFVAICVSILLSSLPSLNYPDHIVGAKEIIRHVIMLGAHGVFWSIPPEIQFYGFFLVLWLVFSEPQKHQRLAIGIALLLVVDAILEFPGPGFLLTSKVPYFLLGALAGRLKVAQPERRASVLIDVATLALLIFFVTCNGLGVLSYEHFWGLHSALAGAAIVYLFACEYPVTTWIFASAPLRFMGSISFSLYLFHVPVFFLTNKLLSDVLPTPLVVSIALVAVVIVSWLSYLIIEGPCRHFIVTRWKNKSRLFADARAANAN